MDDPALNVPCPDCLAPISADCRGDLGTHKTRLDLYRLRYLEQGVCTDCHRPLVRGVPLIEVEVMAWHHHPEDAAVCPTLPDPSSDWNGYALALQSGIGPGRPGLDKFAPLTDCPECRGGKHINCTNEAWLDAIDGLAQCGCFTRRHGE